MARLPPITTKHQIAADHRTIFDSIVQSRGAVQGPFTMFLHSPGISWSRRSSRRFRPLRRLARHAGSRARRHDGRPRVSGGLCLGGPDWPRPPTIMAIRENHSRGVPPKDAEIIELTSQLLRRRRVDDASAKAMLARFGYDGFIELTGAIGY